MQTIQLQLDELAFAISAELWSQDKSWSSAGVLIRKKYPKLDGDAPYVVVTEHSGELSWMFKRLRDIGAQLEGFYLVKARFFYELGEAASRVSDDDPIDILLLTTLREAYQFFGENELRLVAENWSPVFGSMLSIKRDDTRHRKTSVIKFFNERGVSI